MKYLEKETEFEKLINDELVIVDFFATWCGPCQLISPILEELEKENSNLKVIKVDVDKNETLARNHQILSIPTLEIYKKGTLVNKVIGYKSKEQLQDLIK